MRHRWLHLLVAVILILNLADASFTLLWISSGMAVEANPLMLEALGYSPVVFMIAKLALVSLGMLLLLRLRSRPLAQLGIVGSGFVYASLLVYHVSAIPTFIAQL